MVPKVPAYQPGDLCVLAIDLEASEFETLARILALSDTGPRLLGVSAGPPAFAGLLPEDLAAVVTSLASFEVSQAVLPELRDRGGVPPVLVLLSPGEEAAASSLLGRDNVDLLVRTSSHLPLLAAWLPRALNRRLFACEEIGRLIRHEINNPLTGVLGNAELILSEPTPLPPAVRRRLSTIINLTVRLRDVVRTMEERLRRQSRLPNGGARSPSPSAPPLSQEAVP